MKKIFKKKSLIFLALFVIILILFVILNKKLFIINKLTSNFQNIKAEEIQDVSYNVYGVDGNKFKTLIKISALKEIKKISFKDGIILNCYGKKNASRDIIVEPFSNYKFKVIYVDGTEEEKSIFINSIIKFEYTGSSQEYEIPIDGYYNLKAYGASGGNGYGHANPYGLGGYTEGVVYLEKGQKLFIYVGEAGVEQTARIAYNGGGSAYAGEIVHKGGQGRWSNRL